MRETTMSKKYKEKKALKEFLKSIPVENRKMFADNVLNPRMSEEESAYLDGDISSEERV